MNVPDVEAVKKLFVQRYPFLSVASVRATGEKVRTRILTEARANRFTWDVVSFNLLDMDALNREGLLQVDRLLLRLERLCLARGLTSRLSADCERRHARQRDECECDRRRWPPAGHAPVS